MMRINQLLSYAALIAAFVPLAELSASELAKSMKKQQALSRSIRSNIKNKNWVAATDEIQQFFEAYKKNSRLRANVLALSQELADAYTKPGTLPYDSKLVTGKRDLKNLGMAKDAIVTAINAGQFADALAGIKKLETAKYNPLEIVQLYKAFITQVNKAEKTGAPAPAPSPLDPSEMLIKATGSGDLSKVKEALAAGADINLQDKDGDTALVLAASYGKTDIVKTLLDKGADKSITNKKGETAFDVASNDEIKKLLKEEIPSPPEFPPPATPDEQLIEGAANDSLDQVKEALKNKANVNTRNNRGETALMIAIYHRKTEIVEELLKTEIDVNAQDIYGKTALMIAAEIGLADIVKALLNKGADKNIVNKEDGDTALDVASNDEIKKLLKEEIPPPPKDSPPATPDEQLIEGAASNDLDQVKEALKNKANVNTRNNDGETALIIAAYQGNTDIVEELLQKEAGADIDLQDNDGDTALIIAAEEGETDTVKTLLEYGADMTLQNKSDQSVFDVASNDEIKKLLTSVQLLDAIAENKLDQVKEAVTKGANIDYQDDRGSTGLIYASVEGLKDIVEYLLQQKATVDTQDSLGYTALMFASTVNKPEIVKALLNAGADTDLKNNDGKTAFDLASSEEIKTLLQGHKK